MALTDNLLAFYKLNDLTDSSGNNRTLTNNGNVSFASGKIGNAAVFDGNSQLTIPSTFWGGLEGVTVSTWVKIDPNIDPSKSGMLFSIWNNGNGGGPLLVDYSAGNDKLYFVFPTTDGGWIDFTGVELHDGTWKHVVFVYNGSTARFFVDNQQVFSREQTGLTIADQNGVPFVIGGLDDDLSRSFLGEIDAVGIWNRALTEPEIATLYNSGTGLELDGAAPVPSSAVKFVDGVKLLGKTKFVS